MPTSDASDETGIMQMADNATAEKSGATKYSHAQRHDAKLSRQLWLSHSHSTAGQSRHHAGASQKAIGSRQGMSLVDTSSVECRYTPSGGRPAFSDRCRLIHPRRPYGVELFVALFDAASPLVPGNSGTDMVRASALAGSGDFLRRLAG